MKNLRTHGKSTIIWVLMGLMVLGLGGFGVGPAFFEWDQCDEF